MDLKINVGVLLFGGITKPKRVYFHFRLKWLPLLRLHSSLTSLGILRPFRIRKDGDCRLITCICCPELRHSHIVAISPQKCCPTGQNAAECCLVGTQCGCSPCVNSLVDAMESGQKAGGGIGLFFSFTEVSEPRACCYGRAAEACARCRDSGRVRNWRFG